ncbi:vps16-like protein, partial [Cystoisospora suis]
LSIFLLLSPPFLQHTLFLGGPKNEWLPYQYGTTTTTSALVAGGGGQTGQSTSGSSSLHLVAEVDGLRIITAYKTEFLHRIAPSTDAIFSIGSCEPPAMLYYAMERFKGGDAAADESLRSIKQDLGAATEACIDAATHEWKFQQAALLLQAAVFGREFLDEGENKCTCKQYVKACRDLRICYAVRQPPLEMPLSVAQLRHMSLSKLVRRIAK